MSAKNSITVINDKKTLFKVLKDYLDKLFEDYSDDSKYFWASNSIFEIEPYQGTITFEPLIDVGFPIFDVDVEKTEGETYIKVEPYKIDMDDFELDERGLRKIYTDDYLAEKRKRFEMISPMEVLGINDSGTCRFNGEISIRQRWVWNCVDGVVDTTSIIEKEAARYAEYEEEEERDYEFESDEIVIDDEGDSE